MPQNSKYSVWFRTSQGEGYGIVSLMDGNMSGGDNISSFTGTYVQDGDSLLPPLQLGGIRKGRLQCSASTM